MQIIFVVKDLCIRPDRITVSGAGMAIIDCDKFDRKVDQTDGKVSSYPKPQQEKGALVDIKA
jgi:hypothetical protein